MIAIGTLKAKKIFIGGTEIEHVYKGTELIYQKMPFDTEIEYLESTGTQWINTKYIANQDTEIGVKFYASNKNAMVFGLRNDTNPITIWNGGVEAMTDMRFGENVAVQYHIVVGTIYEASISKDRFTCNGDVLPIGNTATFTQTDKIFIGNSRKSGTYYTGKVYSAYIKQNGVLVRDFIPVRVGQVGYMYDKVEGKLYGNSGKGEYILGNDVN